MIFETLQKPQTDSLLAPFFKVSAPSFLVALQGVSKRETELLYAFRIPQKEYQALIGGVTFKNGLRKVTRMYNGYEISELKSLDNKVVLAFAYLDGIFTLSRSSFLIENSIRILESDNRLNFKRANQSLFQFASLKGDAGDVYLNYRAIPHLFPEELPGWKSIPMLTDLARAAVLDVNAFDDRITLNGFTLDSIQQDNGLVQFQHQQPVQLDLMRLIPSSAPWVIHYGISDPTKFLNLPQSTTRLLGDEIAVCAMNANEHLVFIKLRDSKLPELGDYLENYSGYEITSVKNSKFFKPLRALLPPDSVRFSTQLDHYLVLAPSESSLKALIDEVEADDTWGRTLGFQQFLEHGLRESNMSFFFKDWVSQSGSQPWWSIIKSTDMSSITWGGIQFSALDDHFYTSINLQKEVSEPTKKKTLTLTHQLPNTIAAAFPVKNHANSKSELILQDSTFRIYQFTTETGVLWTYPLHGKIISLTQIDFLRNGKLQYLIVTPGKLYLIDRLGRDVTGFPRPLPFEPVYAEVVDYDKTRNYRYLMTQKNEVYILDKQGAALEGWAPKRMPTNVNHRPVHYRIGGKDFFLLITDDHQVHFLNRRGDSQVDPIKLRHPIAGDFFIETGTGLSTSYLYSTSKEGQVMKMSLDGKNFSTDNLVRGNQSKFELVRVMNSDQFYYARIDLDKVVIFSSTNQLVFERQNPGSTSLQALIISLSKDRVIFAFYDRDQGLTYLYDQAGTPIGKAFESSVSPVLGTDIKTKRTYLYTFSQTSITTTPLN